jgi:hypothetical protein
MNAIELLGLHLLLPILYLVISKIASKTSRVLSAIIRTKRASIAFLTILCAAVVVPLAALQHSAARLGDISTQIAIDTQGPFTLVCRIRTSGLPPTAPASLTYPNLTFSVRYLIMPDSIQLSPVVLRAIFFELRA